MNQTVFIDKGEMLMYSTEIYAKKWKREDEKIDVITPAESDKIIQHPEIL